MHWALTRWLIIFRNQSKKASQIGICVSTLFSSPTTKVKKQKRKEERKKERKNEWKKERKKERMKERMKKNLSAFKAS